MNPKGRAWRQRLRLMPEYEAGRVAYRPDAVEPTNTMTAWTLDQRSAFRLGWDEAEMEMKRAQ